MKKKREEHDLIVLEGGKQIMDAIKSNILPKTILFTQNAFDTSNGQEMVQALANHKEVIQLISEQVYNSISDTKHGQGIIATFQKPTPVKSIPTHLLTTSKPLLLVILDRLSDPGNMGTILRSCYGLGVDAVLSIESCDIFSSKVLRSAMGVSLSLPVIECELSEAKTYLRDFQQHASTELKRKFPSCSFSEHAHASCHFLLHRLNLSHASQPAFFVPLPVWKVSQSERK